MAGLILDYVHVIGVVVLAVAGAASAFLAVAVRRARDPAATAVMAGLAVRANLLFTVTVLGVEPLTGLMLARTGGYALTEGWIVISIMIYILVAALWLPVLWIQIRVRRLAREAAAADRALPAERRRLFALSIALALPAFAGLLAILWLMIVKPSIPLW